MFEHVMMASMPKYIELCFRQLYRHFSQYQLGPVGKRLSGRTAGDGQKVGPDQNIGNHAEGRNRDFDFSPQVLPVQIFVNDSTARLKCGCDRDVRMRNDVVNVKAR
jgi:hypothetical protein